MEHAEQPVHVLQAEVVPPVEYVNPVQAEHLLFDKIYPALQVVQIPVFVEQAEQPVQEEQVDVVPPVE